MLKPIEHDNTYMTRAMAHNVSAWTEASVRAYDIPTYTGKSLWWRHPGGPGIYLEASILNDNRDESGADELLRTELNDVIRVWEPSGFGLYDCWASHDLTPLGFEKVVQNPWYLRPPGPLPAIAPPDELSVEVVTTTEQLVLFEVATRIGFDDLESPDLDWEPFSQHHPATLDEPNMTYLIGTVDGQVVSSMIAHATEDMMGIYGLSTLVQFRRRGYAAALVYAAVALNTALPASVFPDPPSVPIYTRIGFAPAGEIAVWKK